MFALAMYNRVISAVYCRRVHTLYWGTHSSTGHEEATSHDAHILLYAGGTAVHGQVSPCLISNLGSCGAGPVMDNCPMAYYGSHWQSAASVLGPIVAALSRA